MRQRLTEEALDYAQASEIWLAEVKRWARFTEFAQVDPTCEIASETQCVLVEKLQNKRTEWLAKHQIELEESWVGTAYQEAAVMRGMCEGRREDNPLSVCSAGKHCRHFDCDPVWVTSAYTA